LITFVVYFLFAIITILFLRPCVKANLSWTPTRVKFCLLIAIFSVILFQLNRTNSN